MALVGATVGAIEPEGEGDPVAGAVVRTGVAEIGPGAGAIVAPEPHAARASAIAEIDEKRSNGRITTSPQPQAAKM